MPFCMNYRQSPIFSSIINRKTNRIAVAKYYHIGIWKLRHFRAEEQILIGDDGKTANRISSSIILPPFVYSDIKTGDKIGEIKYYYDGRYIDSISLNAMKNTEYKETEKKTDKNFFEKIKKFLFNN